MAGVPRRLTSLFLPNQSPLIALSLLSSFFPCFGIRQTQLPHRTCTTRYLLYGATLPLLTIFYIFYRPTPRTLRILLFSEFLFQTVQNVDASFLYSVPMPSLLCSPSFVLSCEFPAQSVLLVRFLVRFFHLLYGFPSSQTTFHPLLPCFSSLSPDWNTFRRLFHRIFLALGSVTCQ